MKRAVVEPAWWLQPFTISGRCHVVDLWMREEYTKKSESFWHRTLALGGPNSCFITFAGSSRFCWLQLPLMFSLSPNCNSADLRGLLDTQHHRSIARRTPSKNSRTWQNSIPLMGQLHPMQKSCLLSRDVDLSHFSLG